MLEVTEVTQAEQPESIAGWIDGPTAGWRTVGHALTISGWVVGTQMPAVSVEVVHGGVVLRSAPVVLPRSDVAGLERFEGVTGAGRSGFATGVGLLGLPRDFRLEVRATTRDGRHEALGSVSGTRSPLRIEPPDQLEPIVVTCLGRSGTTLLMSLLGSHPDVVAEPTYPYETRYLTYWMHVLKVLGEPGAVLPPIVWFPRLAELDAVRPIPFGPVSQTASQAVFEEMASSDLEHLLSFARSSVDDFYRATAATLGKGSAKCFAEKQFPGPIATVIDEVYPERIEIISVRDPRDMLISMFTFMGTQDATVLGHHGAHSPQLVTERFTAELRLLADRLRLSGDRAYVVRYEDLASRPTSVLTELFKHAQLPAPAAMVDQLVAKCTTDTAESVGHRTSEGLTDSLDRWRRSFDDQARRYWSTELEELTLELGYAPTPAAQHTPKQVTKAGGSRALSPALAAELRSSRSWLYQWDFGSGVRPSGPATETQHLHDTRLEMIEGPIRDAIAAAGPGATAVDLACNEGWFAHRLLDWGVHRVVAIDLRPETIRRAQLVRDHFGIAPERLDLRCGDIYELDTNELGTFDVVLMLGLIYHVEDPVGAVRIARRLTRSVCALESKLSRHQDPIIHAVGASGATLVTHGSFATRIEDDATLNPMASAPGALSLIPNRVAFAELARVAGFGRVEFAAPRDSHNSLYLNGDRAVMTAWPAA